MLRILLFFNFNKAFAPSLDTARHGISRAVKSAGDPLIPKMKPAAMCGKHLAQAILYHTEYMICKKNAPRKKQGAETFDKAV